VRPAAMFSEGVSFQGQSVPRFSRIADFEGQAAELAFRWRIQPYMHNAVDYVRSGRYTGHGLINLKDGCPEKCPETQVPVLLENGNTWWYPADNVDESRKRNQWPGWIRRRKRVKRVKKVITLEQHSILMNEAPGHSSAAGGWR